MSRISQHRFCITTCYGNPKENTHILKRRPYLLFLCIPPGGFYYSWQYQPSCISFWMLISLSYVSNICITISSGVWYSRGTFPARMVPRPVIRLVVLNIPSGLTYTHTTEKSGPLMVDNHISPSSLYVTLASCCDSKILIFDDIPIKCSMIPPYFHLCL